MKIHLFKEYAYFNKNIFEYAKIAVYLEKTANYVKILNSNEYKNSYLVQNGSKIESKEKGPD
jgi:hypothetical protein